VVRLQRPQGRGGADLGRAQLAAVSAVLYRQVAFVSCPPTPRVGLTGVRPDENGADDDDSKGEVCIGSRSGVGWTEFGARRLAGRWFRVGFLFHSLRRFVLLRSVHAIDAGFAGFFRLRIGAGVRLVYGGWEGGK
jgi:hypothetical protein